MLHFDRAPMLESVGQLGRHRAGSAIYLGKGWILTANHAFQGRTSNVVLFGDEEYRLRPGGAVRILNRVSAGEPASKTDLVLVPLKESPNLPELEIASHSPFSGETVVMIGCGKSSAADTDILVKTEPDGLMKTRAISGGGEEGEAAGPRWGENIVTDRGLFVGIADGESCTLSYATIRQPGSTEKNAQGASGDSGGGVFVKRGEGWHLSGVMLSVVVREELDASATFIADLSTYREQIAATIPEPSVGVLLVTAMFGLARRRR